MILWPRLVLHLRGTSHWTWPVCYVGILGYSLDPKSVLFCFLFVFLEKGQIYQLEHGQCFASQRQPVWGQKGQVSSYFSNPRELTDDKWRCRRQACLWDMALRQLLSLTFWLCSSSWYTVASIYPQGNTGPPLLSEMMQTLNPTVFSSTYTPTIRFD